VTDNEAMSPVMGRLPRWRVWVVPGVVVVLVAAVAGSLGWFLGQNQVSDRALSSEGSAEPGVERTRTDPLFSDPADLGSLIADTKAITVTVLCNGSSGAGWIIETNAEPVIRPKMREKYGPGFASTVVTADHVIAECRKKGLDVGIQVSQTLVNAVLMNWDPSRDIATIGVASDKPGAQPFTFTPDGTWAMTVGAPVDEALVPTIGQVVHDDGFHLLLHMTSQPGNSGGPIVNSRGEVIATLGGSILDEESRATTGWTYSTPVEALCDRLFECSSMGIDGQ